MPGGSGEGAREHVEGGGQCPAAAPGTGGSPWSPHRRARRWHMTQGRSPRTCVQGPLCSPDFQNLLGGGGRCRCGGGWEESLRPGDRGSSGERGKERGRAQGGQARGRRQVGTARQVQGRRSESRPGTQAEHRRRPHEEGWVSEAPHALSRATPTLPGAPHTQQPLRPRPPGTELPAANSPGAPGTRRPALGRPEPWPSARHPTAPGSLLTGSRRAWAGSRRTAPGTRTWPWQRRSRGRP